MFWICRKPAKFAENSVYAMLTIVCGRNGHLALAGYHIDDNRQTNLSRWLQKPRESQWFSSKAWLRNGDQNINNDAKTVCFIMVSVKHIWMPMHFADQSIWSKNARKQMFFSLIWLDVHDFWSKFGHLYSFLQAIRIWGRKMWNFRARRGKIRKTNVKLTIPIFFSFFLF